MTFITDFLKKTISSSSFGLEIVFYVDLIWSDIDHFMTIMSAKI
ncbi:hypothetical protein [Metabacillus sp. FJAT-53654]|uniref:Uncharacterized protein n=1 Tax=Metabacillus rhizosphaerae TaxID=3117747 RepID=A0ABZ2MNH5_9BACI